MSETYQLFQYNSCPFCYTVRVFLEDAGIEIPSRDILQEVAARHELIEGGGKATVPCLRIQRGADVMWLYESVDIIRYLQSRNERNQLSV